MYSPRSPKGFTLIELLVVIAIIGILSAVVLASLNTARAKSRDAARLSSVRQIETALAMYYADNGQYPLSSGATSPNGSWFNSIDATSWSNFATQLAPYIGTLSIDPQQSTTGWPGTGGAFGFSYYSANSTSHGCLPRQYYMLVWRMEGSHTNPASQRTWCNGTVQTYGTAAVIVKTHQ